MAHPFEITAPTVVNDCTSTTGWAAIAGTLTNPATPANKYGVSRNCLLLTSASATAAYMDLTLNATLSGRLQFLFYLDEFDSGYGSGQNTKTMTVFCSNDAGYTNYFSKTFPVRHGWNLIGFDRRNTIDASNEEAGWSATGTASWSSAMVRIRVRIEAVTGSATRLYTCAIRDGGYYKPQVIVEFDDNLTTMYTEAFAVTAPLGIVGTANIISSKVGESGYCTQAQLQEMYDAGWDMCNHSKSHVQGSYYGGTYAYCLEEIVDCQKYLDARGWNRRSCHMHYAAPFGEATYREASPYRRAIADAGCLTGRSTIERVGMPFVEDPVHMNIILPDGSAETLAANKNRIDAAIGQGGTIRLLFHNIVTPADTQIKWTPSDFADLMEHLWLKRAAGIIDMPTLTQWYEKVKGISPFTG